MFPLVMHWFPFHKWYIETLTHVPQHITLFENRVVADKISQSEAILEEGRSLIQYAWCSFEKTDMWRHTDRERTTWRQRPTLEWHVYTPRNARDWRLWPEARREVWKRFFLKALRRNQPWWQFAFTLQTSRTLRKLICVVFQPPHLSYLVTASLGNLTSLLL